MKTILIAIFCALLFGTPTKIYSKDKPSVVGTAEGYVVFTFDIEKDGTASNIKIIESVPKKLFDEEATKAIKRWKFKPKIVGGEPVKQFNMRYTLEFKLED